MSSPPAGSIDLAQLGAALERELETARRRVDDLEEERRRLQAELDATVAAQSSARQSLEALHTIAERAPGLLPELEAGQAAPEARPLSGGELRETIARVALRRNVLDQPVHWRTWLDWLRSEGYDAAGKSAEATFLTQLARSPLVRRAGQDGVYILDVELLHRRRAELLQLHEQLAALPPPDQLALIGDARDRRKALQLEIGRAERAVEEAWRMLTEELGREWAPGPRADAAEVTDVWRRREPGVPGRAADASLCETSNAAD